MIKYLTSKPWLLSLMLIVIINLPAFIVAEVGRERTNHVVNCVSNWGDKSTERSNALSRANDELRTANDEILRAALSGDRNLIIEKLQKYVDSSNKLKQESREHPIPISPRLVC